MHQNDKSMSHISVFLVAGAMYTREVPFAEFDDSKFIRYPQEPMGGIEIWSGVLDVFVVKCNI